MENPVSSFGVTFLNFVFDDKHFEAFGLDKKTTTKKKQLVTRPPCCASLIFFFGPFYEPEDLKSMSLTA